jgi:hypothetical protein
MNFYFDWLFSWVGFTFGLVSIFFVFSFGLGFPFFCFSFGLATFGWVSFGLAFHLVWFYIWFCFSFGRLPESLFLTVGSVACARRHCSFLLGGSLSSKSAYKNNIKISI